jgi:hypothetical protein
VDGSIVCEKYINATACLNTILRETSALDAFGDNGVCWSAIVLFYDSFNDLFICRVYKEGFD